MSEDADFLIDPVRISTKPQVFRGTFTLADLERLADSLADERGELRYDISAAQDRQCRKVVSCIIEGFVFLICQNSLEAFRHEISIHDQLVLVDDESRLPPVEQEDESEDYVVADEALDIRDLVEDAVLLALPMVPRKPGVEGAAMRDEAAARAESPFAALAPLKKK